MKRKLIYALCASTFAAASVLADEVFLPQGVGIPDERIGTGTRGDLTAALQLAVLAPNLGNRTTEAQPVLYWFVDRPVSNVNLRLSKVDPSGALEAVLDTTVAASAPGIQQLKLADYQVSLEAGGHYEWSLSLPRLPNQRTPLLSVGRLNRIAAPAGLDADVQAAQARAQAQVYADAGLWYAAFDTLRQALATAPNNSDLKAAQTALLEQAGLPKP